MTTTQEKITAALVLPTGDALAAQANQATTMIVGVTIDSDSDLQLMVDELREVKAKRDKLEALRLTLTRPLDQAKQAAMDLFRGPLAAMDGAIEVGKRACLAYTRERDRRLAAEQAERERVAKAERDRIAAEAAELQRQAMVAATAKQAQALADKAAELQVQAVTTVAPILPSPVKATGSHTAKRWTVRVTDKRALVDHLVRSVTEEDLFDALVDVNEAKLRTLATVHGGKLSMPGLVVEEATSMVLR